MRKVPVLLSLALVATALSASHAGAETKPKPVKYGYVVNKIYVPTSNDQARTYGIDMTGDGHPDNQLGMVFAAFASQGVDAQGAVDALVSSGQQVTLLSVRTTSLSNAKGVRVRLFKGKPKASPDLDGGGRFAVDKTAPHADLKAKIVKRVLVPRPGDVPFAVPGFLPGMTSVDLQLVKAVVIAKCTKKRCKAGKIVGAVMESDIEARVIPAIGDAARAVIARDCTGTTEDTCVDGSDGKSMMNLFDTDDDGTVTNQEVEEAPLIQSLLAPDLDLDKNGKPDALSVGMGFTAVNARVRGD
jgi:hypothetical protein